MVQSFSSARNKRARRTFNGTAECTGIHETVLAPTLVTNRRNNLVIATSTGKNFFRRDKCQISIRSRARVMLQPGSVTRYKRARRGVDVIVEYTRIRDSVGCPHGHDGYDPSYIREFHMLVRDSCKTCNGTVWPNVSRHDLP